MKTCKECFHQKACMAMLEATVGHKLPDNHDGCADRCKDFIATADVVPKREVERVRMELYAMRGRANSLKMHYENLAREIFGEIDEILESWYSATMNTYAGDIFTHISELKKKYTEPTAPEK